MSVFTTKEIDYLNHQRLGRLATVDSDGNPHVVPVGFRHNLETDTIDIGGPAEVENNKRQGILKKTRRGLFLGDVFPACEHRRVVNLMRCGIFEKKVAGCFAGGRYSKKIQK